MVKRIVKRAALAVALLPLFLAACAGVPPQSTLKVPERYEQAAGSIEVPVARWWGLFDDPDLNALIMRTLEHNRDLRIAIERVERARALGRADANALLPSGSASVNAARHRVPAVDSPTGDPQVVERVGAGMSVAWEADLFGRLRSAARGSAFEVVASDADVQAFRSILIADAAGAWFQWQGLQAQIDALAAIVEGQRQQVGLMRSRFDLGAIDELELRRAASEQRTSEARLASLRGEQAQVASRIALLSGRFPGELTLAPRDQAALPAQPLALGTPQWALARRPDVGAAEARLRAASAREDAAWASLLPRLTIGGSLGVLAGRGTDLSGSDARTWSVQPAITLPLFDLLQLEPLRRARQAETRIALAAYEKSVLSAIADVEASAATYSAATQRVGLLAARRDDAERTLQLAQARHEAGAIDQLALIDAQRTRRDAALELAGAIAEHRIAVIELYRAIGG